MMNVLQVVVFVLCIGFIGSSCGHANRRDSDGRHEGPNGLDNNGARCYANAVLQLLAACFPNEIEKIPQFSDGKKESIRLNLCKIVNHINANEKCNAGDKKVKDAVRSLTDQLCPEIEGPGGFSGDFARALIRELGSFLGHQILFFRQDTFCPGDSLINFDEKTLPLAEASAIQMDIGRTIRLSPDSPGAKADLSDKELESYWQWKKEVRERLRSNGQDQKAFVKIMNNLIEPGDNRKCVVRFTKLQKKLSPGTKFMTEDYPKSKDRELTFPYEEKSGCWQKFDLVGFVLHDGVWHYTAYVKRKGKWYKANDSTISKVKESDVDQALIKCLRTYYRLLSVYEARA